jgi:RHS repeat-associated protein
MRQGPAGQPGTVTYLHGDHLGSTSLATDAGGAKVARVLYYPYGEERYRDGTLQTDYQFTGQRREGFGLYDYKARFYDPSMARFVSADTIVPDPGNPQTFNRYMYVKGNPLKHTDPSGHCSDGDTACEYKACVDAGNDPEVCEVQAGGSGSQDTTDTAEAGDPIIVLRSDWGAEAPSCNGCVEGFYDPQDNPGGYAPYSELLPGRSLADILDTIVIHHEGNAQTHDVPCVLT